MRKTKDPETILVFCAHNDDQVIGVGGTLANYAAQGKEIFVYIFSYGQSSHPHLKKEIIIEKRVKESQKSDKVLGIKHSSYFGLDEGKFREEVKLRGIDKKLKQIIRKRKPSKIFVHSQDDPHPDHRSVYYIVKDVVDSINYKNEFYSFEVWNVLNLRKTNSPKLVVDISDTFKKKVAAFRMHESQKMALWTLMWNVYLRAYLNGFNNNVKYAEIFFKIK